MAGPRIFSARCLVIRLGVIIVLVLIAFVMYNIGKEHDVLFDNNSASIDGRDYASIAGGSLQADGGKKSVIRPGGRISQKMVGKRHRLKLDIMDGGGSVLRTVERTVSLNVDMKRWMISLPALASGAENIFVSRPVASPAPRPEPSSGDEYPENGGIGEAPIAF
jgi:hypothetical protein